MNTHTANLLEALLFGHCWEYSDYNEEDVSIYDFDQSTIIRLESFIEAFENVLEEKMPVAYERIDELERSFGGNLYFSLSGHGCGFFDERDEELAKIHEVAKKFAPYLFEQVEIVESADGKLALEY